MFLLPSIVLGVVFALLLGGRPSRLLQLELRHGWAVFLSLALQILLFSAVGAVVPVTLQNPLHLATYALLFWFAAANFRNLALLPLLLGLASNALTIVTNGGQMPVSASAWEAAALEATGRTNVRLGGEHLSFLGDVFALPRAFPLANVFSVGDLLIGFGAIALVISVSLGDGSARALVPGRLLEPLRVPSFRRLAAGKLVSHLGDWLTLAALIGWVYDATGSTTHVALLMLVRLVPPILGGGLAALLVDRLPKQRLLVWVEAARGVAVAGALAAVLLESRPLAFVAVAVSGALAAISSATMPALVPSLLADRQLPAANAGLGIAQDGAMALGALGAGIALSAATAVAALAVDLVTFAAAGVLYWGIRVHVPPLGREAPGESLRAGLRHLLERRVLLVVLAFAAATLATGLTNATLPGFLDGELGLGPGAYGFGLAALATGLVGGQAVVGLANVGVTGGRWIGAALLLMASLFAALAFTEHPPTALLLLGLIGFVDGTTDVLFDTIVQRETDPRYYGRVFGFASASMRTTMMVAVAAAPMANRVGDPHEIILFAGLFLLVAAAVALVGTSRRAPASLLPARVGSA